MKKIKLLACIMSVLLLSGCWGSRELEDIAIVLGIAIGREDDGRLCAVSQIIIPSNVGIGESGGGDSSDAYTNYYTSSEHLGNCLQDISRRCGKDVYLSHDLIILFDKTVAAEGIYNYLDYFMRDNELRINVSVLVADGDIADIMDTTSELMKTPAVNMAALADRMAVVSEWEKVTVLDFVENMMLQQKGTAVPCVSLSENSGKDELFIKGCAVFSGDKMVGEINTEETKGILWLTDKMSSVDIMLKFDDNEMGVDVKRAKTKLSVEEDENGEIYFKAKISADVHLITDADDILKTMGRDAVRAKLNAAIADQVNTSLDRMRAMGVDVFGLGDKIYKRKPKLWKEYAANWAERFKKTYVEIEVDSSVQESGSVAGSAKKAGEANLK